MSILDRFSKWSERRLRLSQIKILYQNQSAIEFVEGKVEIGAKMGSPEAARMVQDLDVFRLITNNAIADLCWQDKLDDAASSEMLQVNRALREAYAGMIHGQQSFRAQFGETAGENTAFEKRFIPAVGWKSFGETEWDKMVSKALKE